MPPAPSAPCPRALKFFKAVVAGAAQFAPVPDAYFKAQQRGALSRALMVGLANICLARRPVGPAGERCFERAPVIFEACRVAIPTPSPPAVV